MDHETSDEDEWALALVGDPSAFSRIFLRHRDRVFRHSFRLVPTATDADDAVATVFFETWRRRARIRFVEGSMLPWLLLTATNVARNLRRSTARYRQLLDGLPLEQQELDPTRSSDDDAATNALRRLSLNDQRVITLCVLEDYSEADAADALGVPKGTVKSRLSRAKRRLAASLHESHQVHQLQIGELS